MSEEPSPGPDNWPYLFTYSSNEAQEPVQDILNWLSDKGVGLVLNAQKDLPDYVFTYGMIWNYRETGRLRLSTKEAPHMGAAVFRPGQEIVSGPPNIEYIPQYVREILKQFFVEQGIKEKVKWLVVSGDGKHYDLCFSLESLGNPKKEEHLGIIEAFSWFFPNHFSLVLVSEEHLPSFYDMSDISMIS